jgi:hypothetical protein
MFNVIKKYPEYCSSFTISDGNLDIKDINLFNGWYLNQKEKLVYVHIDKCASTSISKALSEKNFLEISKIDITPLLTNSNYRFFAVLRDPYSRWISGLCEFMTRFNITEKYIIEQLNDKKFIFDMHTAPQHIFLEKFNGLTSNITYLKLDNSIESKINNMIFGSDKILLGYERKSDPMIKLLCHKLFEKYVRININDFNKLYCEDFILYRRAI